MQVFVLHPKQDLHGLGYDPFKHAPEFRGQPSAWNKFDFVLLTSCLNLVVIFTERKRRQAADNNRRGSREAVSTREKLFSSNCMNSYCTQYSVLV